VTLTAHWRRARVLLDGRRVGPRTRVRAGDRIRLINGTNAVESMVERDIVVPSRGAALPDVERELWRPPTNGLVRQTLGARSGQLVRRLTLRPAVPASPLPGRVIALSFDDGPDPTFTPQVLQILAAANVKATFCLVGRQARAYPDLVRAIAAQGHTLCDHTETHPHLCRLPADQIDTQITPPAQFIQTVTGQPPAFLRPPWGDINPAVIAIAHQRGLRVLGWTIDTSDYLKPAPAVLVARVLTAAQPGRIVLMHDGGGDRSHTVAALPTIINQLKAQRYAFVTPPTAAEPPTGS
jgi:peptidoglycan/xylan/chitin deacetylase (PgdA/CDA1 family)